MNQAELDGLNQAISNDARVVYCLGLRPYADADGVCPPLNYKSLITLLNAKQEKYQLGRQVNSLIKELLNAGLLHFEQDVDLQRSFNGKAVVLTLLPLPAGNNYDSLHNQWCAMSLDWQPDDKLYGQLAALVGIIDKAYQPHELGDFVAYWCGRPQSQFTQFQWTQKFVFQIKQKRLATGTVAKHKIGNQVVQAKAEVIADENAKQLVARYSKKAE